MQALTNHRMRLPKLVVWGPQ